MIFETILVGQLESNCYFVADEQSRQAVVIDAGADAEKIVAVAEKHQAHISRILISHGHWDHVGAIDELAKQSGAEVLINEMDAQLLADPMKNLSVVVTAAEHTQSVDSFLADQAVIKVGGLDIKALHTPGHTPGSMAFLIGENLFCGDLVFRESIGRTDLPGGNGSELYESIRTKVMTLPDETAIYPGHGPNTTVGWERGHNPYRTYWQK